MLLTLGFEIHLSNRAELVLESLGFRAGFKVLFTGSPSLSDADLLLPPVSKSPLVLGIVTPGKKGFTLGPLYQWLRLNVKLRRDLAHNKAILILPKHDFARVTGIPGFIPHFSLWK